MTSIKVGDRTVVIADDAKITVLDKLYLMIDGNDIYDLCFDFLEIQTHGIIVSKDGLSVHFPPKKKQADLSQIIGKWPGDETDEEINKALKDMS